MRLKSEENFNKIEIFINKYTQENGRSPSNREIAAATGLSSATVTRYMMVMRERGIIEYNGQRNIIIRTRRTFNDQTLETRKVRLHPENSNMKDIYVDKCIIQGIAVKVMKDIV